MKKKLYLALLIFVSHQAYSQESVPVFRTKSDSVAYYTTQQALRNQNPLPGKKLKVDSLWSVQQSIVKNGIIGWRYQYQADETYTSLNDLLGKSIDPLDVKQLSIENHLGRKLPKEIYACKNLEALELIETRIRKLPRQLNTLTKLSALEVYNNYTPKKLKLTKNTHITFLRLRSAAPGKTPSDFKKFAALDSLDLARNFLVEFPNIHRNKNLTQLVLSGNNLTLEKFAPKQNNTLEVLYLRNNKIQVLPDAIGKFSALKKLSLNYNEVTGIGDGLAWLTKLEELSLYQNKLTAIPSSVYQLSTIKIIDLYYNQIEKIDDRISNLQQLEVLYLSHNKIHTISDKIGDLPNLRGLYLHHNYISEMPAGLSQLNNLQVLRVNDNSFVDFPIPILALRNLENLDISRNKLQNIPPAFGEYKKLQVLVMAENPWEDKDSILALAKRMRAGGTMVHLNTFAEVVEDVIPEE